MQVPKNYSMQGNGFGCLGRLNNVEEP